MNTPLQIAVTSGVVAVFAAVVCRAHAAEESASSVESPIQVSVRLDVPALEAVIARENVSSANARALQSFWGIVLPHVEFNGAALGDVLRFLESTSAELLRPGPRLSLKLGDGGEYEDEHGEGRKLQSGVGVGAVAPHFGYKVHMDARYVTVAWALHMVCKAAGMEVGLDEGKIVYSEVKLSIHMGEGGSALVERHPQWPRDAMPDVVFCDDLPSPVIRRKGPEGSRNSSATK